ncbi:MAG: GntR family transcriptional regulator [Alphaproteobacteria bacterium]|nr:MAG: GntR family transcriptional regulator [Alphaproteobacteria bacterium]
MDQKQVIPIREQIAEQIRSDIIGGKLQPGERLREEFLSERFGVSRGPIRDVFIQLTKEGLLVSRTNRGVAVNDLPSPELQSLMIGLRQKIEIYAMKPLSRVINDDDFRHLDQILENLTRALEANDFTEATKIDLSFHRYMLFRAGGEELVNIWTPIVLRMRMNYKRITTPKQSIEEHQAILRALRDGNLRAAAQALKANIR